MECRKTNLVEHFIRNPVANTWDITLQRWIALRISKFILKWNMVAFDVVTTLWFTSSRQKKMVVLLSTQGSNTNTCNILFYEKHNTAILRELIRRTRSSPPVVKKVNWIFISFAELGFAEYTLKLMEKQSGIQPDQVEELWSQSSSCSRS